MNNNGARLSPWMALGLALALAACGGPPPITASPPKPHSPQAFEVFATGYDGIIEKYIEPIDIDAVALEGLKGFAAIDPALTVDFDERSVHLKLDGAEIAETPRPARGDAFGWAALTVDLATAARGRSREMFNASAEQLYEAVFDGALSELDLFSRYAGADEARNNRARRDGFGGIGIRFAMREGMAVITKVTPGTPAFRVGLKVDDRITEIDDRPVGKESRDVVRKLRGPTDSEVRVTVFRESEERSLTVAMERQHIVPTTVTARLDQDVLYLKITNFNQGTASSVSDEIDRAAAKGGLKGIVLDLRGNPGGLLKQSIKVADLLLTHGHILSTRGRHPDSLHHYEAGGRDLAGGLPVVVMIDGRSASASEIVAAALQDRDRAVLVGTSSYGKGSVQTVIRLPNDGEITLTWSRFMAPSGYGLHGLGVRPAVCTSHLTQGLQPVIDKAIQTRLKAHATFATWRTPGFQDEDRRKELRETCPPERRTGYMDVRIATFLASHPEAYSQVLDISAATVEAHK